MQLLILRVDHENSVGTEEHGDPASRGVGMSGVEIRRTLKDVKIRCQLCGNRDLNLVPLCKRAPLSRTLRHRRLRLGPNDCGEKNCAHNPWRPYASHWLYPSRLTRRSSCTRERILLPSRSRSCPYLC